MKEMDDDFLRDYRKAAETHRQVRQYVQTIAKPGVSMSRLAEEIEEGVRALVGHPGIERTKEHVRQYLGIIEGIHQHA